MSSSDLVSPIVSTEWLKSQLDNGDSNIRVLDVTWASDKDAYEDYKRNHIVGAKHFDIMHEAKHTTLFPRNIPAPEAFEDYAQSLGINKTSHVVVYDSTPLGGMFIGSRAWWMFKLHGHDRVSVLDGGFKKWVSDGFPTDDIEPKPERGDFKTNMQPHLLTKYDAMVANTTTQQFQVCDSRPGDAFRGKQEEKMTGHFPNAKNIPFKSTLLTSDGSSLRPKNELKEVFEKAGVDVSRPLVTMCNSGMSSCTLALAANVLGAPDISLYLGGFTEWKNQAGDKLIEKS